MVTETPARAGRSSAGRIVPLFRPYRLQVAAVIVLIVVTSTIGIINPLLIQVVFNKALFVQGGPNLHLLYVLVGVMALVPVVNGAIGVLQTYETTRVGQAVMQDLRNRLYAHLETLPLSFFTNTKTGEIQSRLANDVGGVQTVVTTTASTILANVVTFVSSIVAMIIISWQLTIVAVITVPAFFWLTKTVGERRRQVSRSTQESLAAMSAISEETLSVSGVLLAKVFGNQARDIARYQRENQRLAGLEVRQQMIGQGFYAVVQSFLSITPALIYLTRGPAHREPSCCFGRNHRGLHRAPDPPVLPGRPAASGLGGAAVIAGPVRPGLRVPRRGARTSSTLPTPLTSRLPRLAAGWPCRTSTSATPAPRPAPCRASASEPTPATWWPWWGRAEPARPPSAT